MVMIQKQCLQAGREHRICQTPAITISNLFQYNVSNVSLVSKEFPTFNTDPY